MAGNISFTCNCCGKAVSDCPDEKIGREISSCPHCGSTVRVRSIVHALSLALFGTSMALPDFPDRKELRGVGMSDWPGYADMLAQRLNYTNTYFHTEPFFDVTQPVDSSALQSLDFIISSEVFEHVAQPVSRAFENSFKLLKPGGHLVLTVPFRVGVATEEHYPELHDYRVIAFGEEYVVLNRTTDGRFVVHEKPVFHGGPGTTLEMRVFGRDHLLSLIADAGFEVRELGEDEPQWGIFHKSRFSLPLLAKRPA